MPVVLRAAGFSVAILLPPREHGPPHVHVRKAGGEVVVHLTPLHLRKVERMRDSDVLKAVLLVELNRTYLLAEWRMHHG